MFFFVVTHSKFFLFYWWTEKNFQFDYFKLSTLKRKLNDCKKKKGLKKIVLVKKKCWKVGFKFFLNSNAGHLQKTNDSWLTALTLGTIISHLFWFKWDVLNILTTARGLAENGLTAKITELPFFNIFTSKLYRSFFNKYSKQSKN